MAEPSDEAIATIIRSLEKRTGRTIDQWVKLVHGMGERAPSRIVANLKSAHGLPEEQAVVVADRAFDTISDGGVVGLDLVAAQYRGETAGLKPIYDFVSHTLAGFATDVNLVPAEGYVSVERSRQFATIQPGSATRLDVAIGLPHVEATERLVLLTPARGGLTHLVGLEALSDVNKELVNWLREAYKLA
ncbi:MAG: DUF4287 domain-containing protein [Gemmatimonadales bacterium]|nr:DUF4287 domain-containing protein [Gemmatimonadales bacterium]